MNMYKQGSLVFIAILSLILLPVSGMAQEEGASDEAGLAEAAVTDKNDKSGTNPINFQRDLRIYNEYLWLNTAGDGNQNLTTLEFRTPFAGGKWQFRTRVPYSITKADFNGDGIDDIDDSGLGDVNFRLMTVPVVERGKCLRVCGWRFFSTPHQKTVSERAPRRWPLLSSSAIFSRAVGGLGRRAVFLRRDCSTSSALTRTRAATTLSRS